MVYWLSFCPYLPSTIDLIIIGQILIEIEESYYLIVEPEFGCELGIKKINTHYIEDLNILHEFL